MKLANLIRRNDRGAVSLRAVIAAAVLAGSAGVGGIGFSAAALAAPAPDVVICHATDSPSNPYVVNSPSTTADAGGHGGPGQHTDPVFPGSALTGKWGDIIPPFPIEGSNPPATYPGLNYSGIGVLIYANGCDLPPDLRIDKAGPATGFVNEQGTYVLTVSNPANGPTSGPANAQITVTDTVPAGWTPISATGQSGKGFTCGIVGQVVTCVTDSNLGQGDTFTVTVVIQYDQVGLRTNTGSVASPSDSNTANNSDTVDTLVGLRPAPDLTLTKAAPANVVVGDAGSYVLTVTNSGNAPTVGTITVADTMPTGVTAGSLSGTGCALAAGVITCTSSGVLLPTQTKVFTIPVTFSTVGSKVNNATVSGGGESNTGNNGATASTVVAGIPDLTLAKAAPGSAVVGDAGNYVLTVTNSGNGPTAGTITVSDTLPAGVTAGSLTGTGCALAAGVVTCTSSGVLLPTQTKVFTIPVTFSTVGTKVNNATVSGGGESNTGNNGATATTDVTAAPVPDLILAKAAPANVVVGDAGSYVLTVTNDGTGPTAGTITVSDTLPAGVTAGSLTGTGCALAAGVITCTAAGPLAPTGTVAFTIPVTFSTVGTKVNNATVSGGGESNTGNNGATATTVVAGIPDLTLAKGAPANVVVGDAGSYVLTVTNSGNGPTAGAITVSDTLPAGVTAGSLTGTGCALAAGVITCTAAGPLAPTGTVAFTIPVTFSTVGTKVNNATVSGGGESNTGNNGATATTVVAGIPDLTLAKGAPANVVVGDAGSYVLTVTNSGNGPTAGAITVSDTLPAGVTAGSLTGTGCALAAGVITCTAAGPLAPTGTVAFTIPVTFSTVGTKVNNATVSGGGESNTGNNGATATTVVAGIPDLTLAKGAPANVVVGDAGSYVLTVTNSGNGPTAGAITVSDTLPAGVTAGSLTGTGCALAAGVITCTAAGPLAPTGTVAFTIPVTFSTVGSKVNNATVSGGGESNVGNNGATATTAVTAAPVPDLKLTKTGPAARTTGDTGSYSLVVENVGTATSTDVITVTDTLPAGVSAVATTSGGFTCTVAGNVVTCATGDDLPVGAANAKTITLPVTFTTPGIKANTATVTVNGDNNPTNNTSTATTSVTDPQGPPPPPPPPPALVADLAVKKTGPASVTPGGTASWVLTVTNKGPGNAAGFSVTDTLPVGVSLTSINGTGFSCTVTTAVCTYNGVLLPGQTAVVNVVGAISPTVAGASLANVVVVGPSDATPSDNTDTLVSVIERPATPGQADLVLDKSAPSAVLPGDPITWTITITNAGTANASGFTVSDPLALGLTLVQAAGDGFTCSGAGVACTYAGTLAPNQVATLLVTAALAEDYTSSSVANTATAPLEGDPTPANNTDTATTAVNRPLDGVEEEPATGEEPAEQPTPTPIDGVDEEPAVAPARPQTLPFTGTSADSLLALAAGLSLAGLSLVLAGRRRRNAG